MHKPTKAASPYYFSSRAGPIFAYSFLRRERRSWMSFENIFKLSSIVFLLVVAFSVKSYSKTKKKNEQQNSTAALIEKFDLLNEAEMINFGAFSPHNLTRVGDKEDKR